jgi:hypothetical protein
MATSRRSMPSSPRSIKYHHAVSSYCAARMSGAQRDFLAGLAPTVVLDVDGLGETLFCHGTPRSDTERITTVTPDARLRRIVEGVGQSLVVCGHTHRQFDRRIDAWRRCGSACSIPPIQTRSRSTGSPAASATDIDPRGGLRRSLRITLKCVARLPIT